jgi:hypothetical protein
MFHGVCSFCAGIAEGGGRIGLQAVAVSFREITPTKITYYIKVNNEKMSKPFRCHNGFRTFMPSVTRAKPSAIDNK